MASGLTSTKTNRARSVERVLWIVLVLNLAVAAAKFFYGLASGSASMQADGIHSVFDTLGNVVGLVGIALAARPADESHPYGHAKFETYGSLVIGVLLSFVEFPLLPGVTWLKYDASAVPALISGFAFGPAGGVAVGLVGAAIHGILFADFSGAVMNMLVVTAFVAPSALLWRRSARTAGRVAALAVGCVSMVAFAIAGNLVITPAWLGVPLDAVVAMIVPVLVPFNALKAVLNAVLAAAAFRAIRPLLKGLASEPGAADAPAPAAGAQPKPTEGAGAAGMTAAEAAPSSQEPR